MSDLELFPQWRQAFAFFPEIEVGSLFATVQPRGSLAKVGNRVALQLLMQQLSDDGSQLLDRQTWRRLFPPATSLASGTTWRSTPMSDDGANPPTYGPGTAPSPFLPWPAADIPQC